MEGIRRLKAQDGPDLIVSGSAMLASSLLDADGLVDDLVVAVYPMLLGRGKRFFPERGSPRELAFVGSRTTPTGVLLNTYRCVGRVRTQ